MKIGIHKFISIKRDKWLEKNLGKKIRFHGFTGILLEYGTSIKTETRREVSLNRCRSTFILEYNEMYIILNSLTLEITKRLKL